MLKIATVVATLVATSALATHAEAHGMGSFYASPFFRNQGRQPAQPHCENERERRFQALERARERQFAEIQAERAAKAAAAKRARLLALQKQQAAAKQARLAELKKQQEAAKALALKETPAPSPVTSPVAKRGDMLPVTTTTAENDQPNTVKAVAVASPATCRAYSPAADALVEVPCK